MHIPTNDEDQIKFLVNLFYRVRDEMADFRQRASSYYRYYNSDVGVDYPLKFKLFYPLAFSTIETAIPRYVHGLLYRQPLVDVRRAHPMTDPMAVQAVSRLLNKKWLTDAETFRQIKLCVKESLITGTAAAKIVFRQKRQKVWVPKPMYANGRKIGDYGKYQTIIAENRPRLIHRDIYDVYPDIGRDKEDELRFVIDSSLKSMDEIRFGDIKYDNVDQLEKMGDWCIDSVWAHSRIRDIERDSDLDYNYTLDQFTVPDKPRKLDEFVTREQTKDGEVIKLITLGNEKVKMREEILPYWPWAFFRNNVMPSNFLGRSELQPIESIQLNLNDLWNMNMEQALMALCSMWILSDECEADLDQFEVQPNGIIQITGPVDGVRRESWGGVDAGGLKLQESLMQAGRDATGISDYLRGSNPSRKEFATTVMALQQAAEARLDSHIKEAEKTSLTEVARRFVECAQNYMEDPEYVEVQDNSFESFDMSMIQGLMDYQLHGAAMGVKELDRASINDFAGSVGQIIGPQAPLSFRLVLVKAMQETFENLPEEISVALDGLIQQAQAAEAAGPQAASPQAGAGAAGAANGPPGMAGPPENSNPAQNAPQQAAYPTG